MAREMKDSGIEWIGEIPKEWDVIAIKYLLSNEDDSMRVGPFGSQLSGSDFDDEGEYWVYTQRTVLDNNFQTNSTMINAQKYNQMLGFRVRKDDILITTRGTIGKIARVPDEFYKGVIHPCIIKFRINDEKINYNLLRLLFNESDLILKQMNYYSNATTIEVIYSSTLKNIIIPYPREYREQEKIAAFLDRKCAEIDKLIADKTHLLEELENYKKSVIYEYVTGKKEVPACQ